MKQFLKKWSKCFFESITKCAALLPGTKPFITKMPPVALLFVFCLNLLQQTRGAHNPNLSVAIEHAWHVYRLMLMF